jgi:hypothetical protein
MSLDWTHVLPSSSDIYVLQIWAKNIFNKSFSINT